MAPDGEAEEADEDARVDHDGRAEERLAREGGDDLRDHAERREDEDVDLGVAERPEEMLPEVEIGARSHVVEVRPEKPVEHQEDETHRHHRKGEDDEKLHDQAHPDEQRHAHQRHAGGAQVEDGDDEVDAGDHRRHAEDL